MSEGWSVCFSHNNNHILLFILQLLLKTQCLKSDWLIRATQRTFLSATFVDLRPKVNVTFHVIGKNQTTEQWGGRYIEVCRSHYITVFPPKIRHTHKISRSRISKHLRNISPTPKIRPSDRRGYAAYRRGTIKKMGNSSHLPHRDSCHLGGDRRGAGSSINRVGSPCQVPVVLCALQAEE